MLYTIALCGGLMLAACSHRAKESSAVGQFAPAAPAAPPGVSTGLGTTHSGIYPPIGEPCCWLAGDAKFVTSVPSSARTLTFKLFVPDVAPIVKNGETVTVLIDDKRVNDTKLVPGRSSAVRVRLPAHAGGGDRLARVELRMSYSYVPKDEHVNEDLRRLSVMLTAVTAI